MAEGSYDELHPLSELPHPLIAKATASFGGDGADDNYVGPIASSTTLRLLEIKIGQWRGGVWEDPSTDVRWLVVAGLAKGDHEDHDDFYQRVQRENENGDPNQWLPIIEDERLLKRETAARLLTEWELGVQDQLLEALRAVQTGGSIRFEVRHPRPDEGLLATVTLDIVAVREPEYEADEIDVEISPAASFASSHLTWQLTVRTLISLHPPEQDWYRVRDTYSNIAEPGAWSTRVTELETLAESRELAVSEPGSHSHYAHREHLAGSTIEGRAVRALCGIFFVPTQDHDSLQVCPDCAHRYSALPK